MKLAEKGIIAQGNITNIKRLCMQQGIPVEIEVTKIQHGWEGSAKGVLQVLWERGFINEKNLKQYTADGRKDAFDYLQPHTSLKYLLDNCTDFNQLVVPWEYPSIGHQSVTVSWLGRALNIVWDVQRMHTG
jgi:hypothetical protein